MYYKSQSLCIHIMDKYVAVVSNFHQERISSFVTSIKWIVPSVTNYLIFTIKWFARFLLDRMHTKFNENIHTVKPAKTEPLGPDKFVQLRQVFVLHRFKLHKHLIDGTVKSAWFRKVFGLTRVRFRQVSMYIVTPTLCTIMTSCTCFPHMSFMSTIILFLAWLWF